ncbi:unnamed protein product, partial [Didymodactylos carnosus]
MYTPREVPRESPTKSTMCQPSMADMRALH